MKTEQQLIDDASEDVIKQLYAQYFATYSSTGADPDIIKQAELNFVAGITNARIVHARAIALLPP